MDIQTKQQYTCQDCGMAFFSSHQLVNHTKKFCSATGLNSLEGLANYENKNAYSFSKKNQIPGVRSQNVGKFAPNPFTASQLQRDAKQYHKHREQLQIHRPYSNYQLTQKQFKSSTLLKEQSYNIRPNNIAKNGSRILGDSDVSMKPLNNFGKMSQNNEPLAYVKLPGATVLNKSNTSIANMTKQQKQEYVNSKLIELQNIEDTYAKSGGKNDAFRKNVQKMQKFYKKMLQQNSQKPTQFGSFYESRAQTPIGKLRESNLQSPSSMKQKTVYDSLDRQIISAHKKSSKANISRMEDFEEQEVREKFQKPKKKKEQYPMVYPPYPMYPPPTQPQIIMMPPYQQQVPNQNSENVSQQLKYLQKMIELKNDENKRLMQMIVKSKEEKSNFKENIKQIHQSRASSIAHDHNHLYHLQKPLQETTQLTPEERILVSLHRQELDELKLLSNLPEELQEVKMQSVMRLVQARTQIEKEVLRQKLQRLEEQEKNQLAEQKRKIQNDKWVSKQRKRMIRDQIDNYQQRYVQNDEVQEEEEQQEEMYGQGQ